MRRFATALITLAALVLLSASCGKEDKTVKIAGEWNIVSIETKTASIGSQSIDVYISFMEDGQFMLWQKTGSGRYEKFTGSWTLSSDVLSGTYSDGSAWANDYDVSLSGNTLTLSSRTAPSEISVYQRTSIPEEVLSGSI